jgi:hypothetical protein
MGELVLNEVEGKEFFTIKGENNDTRSEKNVSNDNG